MSPAGVLSRFSTEKIKQILQTRAKVAYPPEVKRRAWLWASARVEKRASPKRSEATATSFI
jgi:hypothetical protein